MLYKGISEKGWVFFDIIVVNIFKETENKLKSSDEEEDILTTIKSSLPYNEKTWMAYMEY